MNKNRKDNYINVSNATLLLDSTVIHNDDNYSFLVERLIKNKDHVFPKKDLEFLTEEQRNLMSESLINELYNNSSKEWQYTETIYNVSKEDSNCSLCGQRIKIGYVIINKLNDKRFVVGKDCILTYRNLKHADGTSINDILKEQKKSNSIRNNKVYLEKNIPGITNNITRYQNFERYLDMFVSDRLKSEYDKTYNSLYKNYNEFIKSSSKSKRDMLFKDLRKLNENLEKIKMDMNNYVEKAKDKKWPVTKEIKEWCEVNNSNKAIDFIRKDGEITYRILYCVLEDNLVKQVVEKVYILLNNTNYKVKEFKNNTKEFVLINKKDKRIELIINYKDLIGAIGKEIINQNFDNLDEKEYEILDYVFIKDYNSYYYCCIELDKIIKINNMTILTDNIDLDNNTLYILDYIKKIVYSCNLKDIIKKYIKQIIKGSISNEDRLILSKYILSNKSEKFDEYKEREKIKMEFYKKF